MLYDKARIFVQGGGGGNGVSSFRREAHVPHDRVPHRGAGGFPGVAGDRDQRRALRQQRPREVRVVREHRGADHEHEVVPLERL